MGESAVYKIIELVGRSDKSIEDAINVAVNMAAKTLENLSWFKVIETRGDIEGGKVNSYQVILNVGFKLESTQNNTSNIHESIAAKHVIKAESPAKDEQNKFIAEGGNSQPLAKPE